MPKREAAPRMQDLMISGTFCAAESSVLPKPGKPPSRGGNWQDEGGSSKSQPQPIRGMRVDVWGACPAAWHDLSGDGRCGVKTQP
jgi:hypothetical protein